MNKINIILDASYMFYRSLGMWQRFTKGKPEDILKSEKNRTDLKKKILVDILAAARKFGNTERVILAIDSHSWRKDIAITGTGYKANRVKNPDFDWATYYAIIDNALFTASKMGIIVTVIDNLEADDIIYLWSDYLYKKGEHCIIIANDSDLHQLVKPLNFYGGSVVMWDNNSRSKKLISHTDLELDVLPHRDQLKKIIIDSKHHPVEPSSFILNKLMQGDGSDNIPEVIKINESTLNKARTKYIDKVGEIDLIALYVSDFFRDEYSKYILESLSLSTSTYKDLSIKIKNNIQLMHLDYWHLPNESILMFEQISSNIYPQNKSLTESALKI